MFCNMFSSASKYLFYFHWFQFFISDFNCVSYELFSINCVIFKEILEVLESKIHFYVIAKCF
jgi:hypothetical protein